MAIKQKIFLIAHTGALFGVMATFKLLLRYVLRPNIEDNFDKRNSTDTKNNISRFRPYEHKLCYSQSVVMRFFPYNTTARF